MQARHLEILVEEPSMEAFLRALLPRVLSPDCTFEVHASQGKTDLLSNLESRLRGYARWLPADWRILVLVDRDNEDCRSLKKRLEASARQAGMKTRSRARTAHWQLANRIAIEELEAWYFGAWDAVRAAYPRVSSAVVRRRGYRDPDAVVGGTWEAFERVMQKHGYFQEGLEKIAAARAIGARMVASRNHSASFQAFHAVLAETAT